MMQAVEHGMGLKIDKDSVEVISLLLVDYRCRSSYYHISSSAVFSECQYRMEPGFWSGEICDWV